MIKARVPAQNPQANLTAYQTVWNRFTWDQVRTELTFAPDGRINIVRDAVDRWAALDSMKDRPALVFEKAGRTETLTFADLKEQSCRWANLFREYGLRAGDILYIFLPVCPEIYLAMLACARLGVIFSPLYSTLHYTELEVRLRKAPSKGVLTCLDLLERLPGEVLDPAGHVFLVDGPAPVDSFKAVSVAGRLERMSVDCEPEWLDPSHPLYLLFTSGSTGPPKGVVHAHRDMLGYLMTGRYVLDLTEHDVLWTDADPAWVTGTVYSTFAPWLCGVTTVVQGDPFSASTWYRTLERHRVSVWYTTPRNINWIMAAGEDLPRRYDLDALRHIASVGESLAPELFYWCKKHLGLAPHENWWMTETGMICLANYPSMDIKPGSMGKPMPGVEVAVVDEQGERLPLLTLGELALKVGWPAMMTGIWQDDARYEQYFRLKGWFLTGDMALMDEDGYFYHQGRNDDLIKAGEKLLGPFEIEHVLYRHPAVNEAAVISMSVGSNRPFVKAYVTPYPGVTPSARLGQEIKEFVRANLSSEIPLREVVFVDKLPKTLSGKLLRRVLRARELGLPEGDPTRMQD